MPASVPRRYAATILERTGRILLRGIEPDAAALAFRAAARIDAGNLPAHQALSAIQYFRGEIDAARKTLVAGVRNNPLSVRHCAGEPRAHVLAVRGVQGGHYMVQRRRNMEYKVTLRGGNFADRYLINWDDFTVIDFFLLDGNILSCAEIPKFDIIVNTIADPDRELESLRTLTEFVARNVAIPVINDPEKAIPTTRDSIYQRFKEAEGFLVPKTLRVAGQDLNFDSVIKLIEENSFSFPVLVRETGTHTGMTFEKFEGREDLEQRFSYGNGRELYVSQYVESLFHENYFRKMRVFFVDGQIYPVVCHIDTAWNVHGSNRKELMLKNPWMMDEEKAFLSDCRAYLGEARYELLQGLHDEIGLDFFGVDFTVMEDGTILLFELNPVMRHSFDHAGDFPYLAPYLQNITDAFNRMIVDRVGAA